MIFDVYDKNKLISILQIDDYERVTYCRDCEYYYSDVPFPTCCYHDMNVQEYDYCSKAELKEELR